MKISRKTRAIDDIITTNNVVQPKILLTSIEEELCDIVRGHYFGDFTTEEPNGQHFVSRSGPIDYPSASETYCKMEPF